jgi:hypothetical protein
MNPNFADGLLDLPSALYATLECRKDEGCPQEEAKWRPGQGGGAEIACGVADAVRALAGTSSRHGRSAFDAVDGSSTGTQVPSMWALLGLPRFGGANMQTVTTIGLDIAKSVFQIHGR